MIDFFFISFIDTSYSELLDQIKKIITSNGFSTKIPVEQRRVLRITINNIFSPIWDSNEMNVVTFLYKLRILIRSSYASCLITTRAQIVNDVRIYFILVNFLLFKVVFLGY